MFACQERVQPRLGADPWVCFAGFRFGAALLKDRASCGFVGGDGRPRYRLRECLLFSKNQGGIAED